MPSISGFTLSPKAKKISTIGLSTAGAAALALTIVPGTAAHGDSSQAPAKKISAENVAFTTDSSVLPKQGRSITSEGIHSSAVQVQANGKQADSAGNATTTAQAAKASKTTKAEAEAKNERASKEAANRSEKRAAPAKPSYPDNLDGWIREARDIMKSKGIPGSYEGIKRNIIRESAGDPNAMNGWDVNAQKGTPSKGLLQVIQPTFDTYHVEGTPDKLTDPVANIAAACNYAADRYGSMDNVNSAY
ncbi:transglycosylase SLT domain-containing protein [Streptomyces iconiensis]|uniref:Transglycosylase SLT domain-containing protein n=1 Tax=Streptomyces iconiensis TaxID=1384038 RepID=A0ABT7A216_9ACTN|nr:transglycosylase SLT domain-containing protein [Streptomyces iconiensis]MDJ1135359.1 transglycosylase SLT domain-containing protein [Streptomyces iconiensis]